MAEVLRRASRRRQLDLAVALAELPLQIRGFGPVKQADMPRRPPKRREEMLARLPRRGAPTAQAAE